MPQVEGATYFNNFEKTGYDELKDWTPTYYQTLFEADTNLRFAGYTNDIMAQALEDFCKNMFVDTMGVEAVRRMEAFYHLPSDETMPLEDRRRLVNLARNGGHKLTGILLYDMVRQYTGAVDPKIWFDHILHVEAELIDADYEPDSATLLGQIRKMIPAHIMVDIKEYTIFTMHLAEIFNASYILLGYKLPFFEYDCYDGSFNYDGTHKYDAVKYGRELTTVSMGYEGEKLQESADSSQITASIFIENVENVSHGLHVFEDADGPAGDCDARLAKVPVSIQSSEAVGGATCEEQKNLWYFDGSYRYNGSRFYNAHKTKEDI